MSPNQDFEEKKQERKVRRRVFHLIFAFLVLISGGFLIWKLNSLVVPVIVGALLAFLFRPVKERFKIT
jgi:predicted PurR-regulated permease PerM